MKKIIGVVAAACVLVGLGACAPRNTETMQPITEALNGPRAAGTVDKNVRLYFGDQRHPRVAQKFGTYTSNKKTNGVNKTDPEACQWAFLSAIVSLQSRAVREGGNAVVNINSYFKRRKVSNRKEYMCVSGNLFSGVALRGTVVRLRRR